VIKLKLEVAETPLSLAQGLMYRKHLPQDQGMLFKFQRVLEAGFWGKDTYIPLDVAFLDTDGMITSIKPITPMSTRLIHSDGDCTMAIEANAGFFADNNIHIGHQVEFIKNQQGKEVAVVFQAHK
jgi:hypothetical protein